MRKCQAVYIALILSIAVFAGCAQRYQKPAPPTIPDNEKFYYDEGAHFEVYYEYWAVHGVLHETGSEAPIHFTAHFNRTGSAYLHARNGYNSLRLPDGGYDYRSFGMGTVMVLMRNTMKEKADRFPGISKFRETYEKAMAGDFDHFEQLQENKYDIYRTRLYIHLGDNRLERVSDKELKYDLDLSTWAGPLSLTMESPTDPMYFDASKPMLIDTSGKRIGPEARMLQGYAFPRLAVKGSLERDGKRVELEGTAWFEHWWGMPDGAAMANIVMISQRLESGASMLVAQFYNVKSEMQNSHVLIQKPDGEIIRNEAVELAPLRNWKSEESLTRYDIGWRLRGRAVSGTVEAAPGAENSEIMLGRGVGNFWLGPCNFKGRVGRGILRSGTRGEGFCRVVSSDESAPGDAKSGK